MTSQTAMHSRLRPTRRLVRAVLVALLATGTAACVTGARADATKAAEASALAHANQWPALHSPIPRDDRLEARIRALLATMTIEEKVGQIIQADLGSVTPDDVRKYRLGSVLAGGNSDPGRRYNAPAADWLALADDFYKASMDTSGGGKAIPILLGIDAVHGHNNVVGATLYPHNIGLGATNDPALLRQIAAATAVELRTTGFDWTFAPTVTVPRDDRWGRTYEGYSEDPALVARYATAVVEGLQGKAGSPGFLDAMHVASSSKHFIGDGGTANGKDTGDARISEDELRDIHGAGHFAAIAAGTQTVMASFSSWNGQRMHGNKSLLTDVLKGRLGFDGFVIGDWNGHGTVPGCTSEDCPAALLAGLDMYMAPDSWRGLYTNTLAEVRSGVIPMARLDDAVTRILRVKFRLHLFDEGLPSQRPLGGKFEQLGSPEHRRLAREAVRESLVLLKNDHHLLPLDPHANVLVAGDGADDIGKQAGGWTLSWQGTGNKPADFPNAESIWSGIRAATGAAGGHATLSVEGQYTTKPDVAIVVFGEDPYAEFIGDRDNLLYRKDAVSQQAQEHDLNLLRRLHADGIPVVAVFLSGRPLWVNREINASDAFVAAWLPGSEGGGVADLLFRTADGKVAYDFTGRLSYSWPKTANQGPLNVGQAGYDPQFAFGYGLGYGHDTALGTLSEDSGLKQDKPNPDEYYAAGKLAIGWTPEIAGAAGEPTSPIDKLEGSILAPRFHTLTTDHLAQEDAWKLVWTGTGPLRFWIQTDEARDLSGQARQGLSLVITMRLDTPPTANVDIGMACGTGCAGRVALTPLLGQLTPGRWTRVAVPLKCFEQAGADLKRVTGVLELGTAGAFSLAFSRVALGTEYDQAITCPAP